MNLIAFNTDLVCRSGNGSFAPDAPMAAQAHFPSTREKEGLISR